MVASTRARVTIHRAATDSTHPLLEIDSHSAHDLTCSIHRACGVDARSDAETPQLSLVDLTVDDLRCIEHAELHLHPGHNLIWGGNGSGKTSLLESIFLLGRGRSFRTRNSERLIGHGKERLVVFGRTAGAPEQTLGIQVSRAGGTLARIGGTATGSPAGPSQAFSGLVIDSGAHKLGGGRGHTKATWE